MKKVTVSYSQLYAHLKADRPLPDGVSNVYFGEDGTMIYFLIGATQFRFSRADYRSLEKLTTKTTTTTQWETVK